MPLFLALSLLSSGPFDFELTSPPGPVSPVALKLPGRFPPRNEGFVPRLYRLSPEGRKPVECQIEGGRRLCFFLPARKSRGVERFSLEAVKHKGTPPGDVVKILEPRTGAFLFRFNDQPLLSFNYGFVKKEGLSPRYDRCDYIHPVFGPEGERLTDDFPKDHPHHRGIFWIWPRVFVGEKLYDPWALADSRQWPRSLALGERGPVCASLEAEFMWRAADGGDLVREKVFLRVWRPVGTTRVFDLEFRLWAAGPAPTKIGGRPTHKKGYGGLNVRLPPRSEAIITMDGRKMVESMVNQKPARWSDFSAVFPGAKKRSGIAVCAHPENPAWPERWCNRYYGILGAASPGLSLLSLDRKKPVTFRYRLVVHAGTSEDAGIEGLSRRFTQPVKVAWKK